MTAPHRTLSLILITAATGCSTAPEPAPQPVTEVRTESEPMAPAPMAEVVTTQPTTEQPTTEGETPEAATEVETTTEPATEVAVDVPAQPVQPVQTVETVESPEAVIVGEVDTAPIASAPSELTLEFLQELQAQMRRDIRHDRMDKARERFATVRGRLVFDNQDPRAGIAGDIELIGGFLDNVVGRGTGQGSGGAEPNSAK